MTWITITNNTTQYDSSTLVAFMNEVVRLYEVERVRYDAEMIARGRSATPEWRRPNPCQLEVFSFPSASHERPIKMPELRAHHRTRLSVGTVGAVTDATPMSQLVAGVAETSSLPSRFYECLAARTLQLVGVLSRWHSYPVFLDVPELETKRRIAEAQRKKNLYVDYSLKSAAKASEIRTLKKKSDAVAKANRTTQSQPCMDERLVESVSTRVHEVMRHVMNLTLLPKVGEPVSEEMLKITRGSRDVIMACRNKLQTALDKIAELEEVVKAETGGEL